MAENTKIEWADHTASPWYGCSHAVLPDGTEHPGCANCYAERMSKRNPAVLGVWGPDGTRVASQSFAENCRRWDKQVAKSGQRVIVFPSLDDPFEDFTGWVLDSNRAVQWHCRDCNIIETIGGVGHCNCCQVCGSGNGAPATMDDLRRDLFALIDECSNLTFTLLTKRPQNVIKMWPERRDVQYNPEAGRMNDWSMNRRENVWLLTSVSDQHTAVQLIPALLECRDLVPVLGLSIEPLLGPVDLRHLLWTIRCNQCMWTGHRHQVIDRETEDGLVEFCPECDSDNLCDRMDCMWGSGLDAHEAEQRSRLGKHCPIDWVIVGGESGPGARPMHPDWVRSLRGQCQIVDVPFFFKQWGEWSPEESESHPSWMEPTLPWADMGDLCPMYRVGKHAAGRLLDGVVWSEYPTAAVAAE